MLQASFCPTRGLKGNGIRFMPLSETTARIHWNFRELRLARSLGFTPPLNARIAEGKVRADQAEPFSRALYEHERLRSSQGGSAAR